MTRDTQAGEHYPGLESLNQGAEAQAAEIWGQQLQPHWPPPHTSNMPSILLHQGHMRMLFPLPVMPSPKYTPGLLPRPLPVSAQMSPSLRGLPYHPIQHHTSFTFHPLALLYFSSYYLELVVILYISVSPPLKYKLSKGRDLACLAPWGIPSP